MTHSLFKLSSRNLTLYSPGDISISFLFKCPLSFQVSSLSYLETVYLFSIFCSNIYLTFVLLCSIVLINYQLLITYSQCACCSVSSHVVYS